MTSFGFKRLTVDNWLEPDGVLAGAALITSEGISHKSGDDWAAQLLERRLEASVPENIRRMFEVARGCMIYGSLFYPLFTVGFGQLSRVADAAAKAKCAEIDAPKSRYESFDRALKYLQAEQFISSADATAWRAVRELRNMEAHASDQRIMGAWEVIIMLDRTVHLINALFP